MRSGSPAALSWSLSGTLTARVRTTTSAYTTSAAATQGSTERPSPRSSNSAARPVNTSAPKKVAMNRGLMIARSIDWNAPTKVRSSVLPRPGMIA